MNATAMTVKTILLRIIICAAIVLMWAWMSADEWEQELLKQSSALSEDYVDTTPLPIAEPDEPIYTSAKKSVVKTKKRIKNSTKRKN
jgi:hypothetical protein